MTIRHCGSSSIHRHDGATLLPRIVHAQANELRPRAFIDDNVKEVAMKPQPDSVNRDLDDEVAEVVEQQYAKKLMKRTVRSDAPARPNSNGDAEMEQQKDKSGT